MTFFDEGSWWIKANAKQTKLKAFFSAVKQMLNRIFFVLARFFWQVLNCGDWFDADVTESLAQLQFLSCLNADYFMLDFLQQ